VTTGTAISLDTSTGPATEALAGSLDAVLSEIKMLQQAVHESEALPPAGARP
jgi:hypothetical protein